MKEYLTFKSGKFYFTVNYDKTIIDPLLIKAIVLNETIKDLPILPNLAAQFETELMIRSIFGTAAIEGNPLDIEDVTAVINDNQIKTTSKHQTEIKNLLTAYKFVEQLAKTSNPIILTEEIISKLHETITSNLDYEYNIPRKYRTHIVKVGDKAHGGIYTPPKIIEDIKALMNVYIEWINSDEMMKVSPFIRGSLAHYYFSIIHPFADGNGRTARMIETLILESSEIKYVSKMLSNYYYSKIDDYYIAFSKTLKLKKDVTPFLKFVLEGIVLSLEEIKNRIIFIIRQLALRDFYNHLLNEKYINKRQHSLMMFLLKEMKPFTLKKLLLEEPYSVLYVGKTEQTARRDIKKLLSLNLINQIKGKEYIINIRRLD
ncbi:Fic family protein [Deferribacter autotrophicus]|uniref:Fic family protein n=1 Tax=Deferribacter autotrophicus TaxID=500465 RepID=A0A5A8F8Q0_9BACT|nr:Fic family protein [Deferribacter autotrophicus]KAA0258832.1 Fic family protein [Deferribacter autotrophicus]